MEESSERVMNNIKIAPHPSTQEEQKELQKAYTEYEVFWNKFTDGCEYTGWISCEYPPYINGDRKECNIDNCPYIIWQDS